MSANPVAVAAIVPAAGAAARMGRAKQLLDIGGRPMVLSVITALTVESVVSVTLVIHPEIEEQIAGLLSKAIRLVRNDDRASGMIDSVRIGMASAGKEGADLTGYLVCPCDAAGVTPADVRRCMTAFAETPDRIVVGTYSGRRGHPLIFPSPLAEAVRSSACDNGLNQLARRYPERVREVPCESPGTIANVNTPADYERARELNR